MLSVRLGSLLLIGVAASVHARSASAEKSPQELVQQLGDAKFVNRQLASEELTRRGLAALEAVRKGTESSDGEIRY